MFLLFTVLWLRCGVRALLKSVCSKFLISISTSRRGQINSCCVLCFITMMSLNMDRKLYGLCGWIRCFAQLCFLKSLPSVNKIHTFMAYVRLGHILSVIYCTVSCSNGVLKKLFSHQKNETRFPSNGKAYWLEHSRKFSQR